MTSAQSIEISGLNTEVVGDLPSVSGTQQSRQAQVRGAVTRKVVSARETQAPEIIGEGRAGITQRRYWTFASRSCADMTHTVWLHSSGDLDCSCAGWFYRQSCVHCDVVRLLLDEEAATRAGEELRYGITPKGLAYLAQWRAEQARRADDEYHDAFETASVAEEWR